MNSNTNMPKIELFSDGGANPNPGKGGYGVILSYKGRKKEIWQGYKLTTNNRMELLGVIEGLTQLKRKSVVTVYTDSQYMANGVQKGWAKKWKKNNWYRNKNEKAINIDLWDRLLELVSKNDVKFVWIKGHNGHPENERCDELASIAMNQKELVDDIGYDANELNQGLNEVHHQKILAAGKSKKKKIVKVGDLCRKCNTPVEKEIPKRKKMKQNQSYFFEYYMRCPSCKQMYMVEDAKRKIDV